MSNYIICPYCGDENDDTSDYCDGRTDFEYDCPECDKKSMVNIEYSITFESKKDCELNNETHEWIVARPEAPCVKDGKTVCKCVKCGKYRFVEEN